jgi:hypothetical protein
VDDAVNIHHAAEIIGHAYSSTGGWVWLR